MFPWLFFPGRSSEFARMFYNWIQINRNHAQPTWPMRNMLNLAWWSGEVVKWWRGEVCQWWLFWPPHGCGRKAKPTDLEILRRFLAVNSPFQMVRFQVTCGNGEQFAIKDHHRKFELSHLNSWCSMAMLVYIPEGKLSWHTNHWLSLDEWTAPSRFFSKVNLEISEITKRSYRMLGRRRLLLLFHGSK